MRLPSLVQIALAARSTAARFPVVLLDAFAGTVAVLILIDYEGPPAPTFLVQVLFAAILGIPLLTGLVLLAERMKWSRRISLGLQVLGLILLAAYGMTVPQELTDIAAVHVVRLLTLSVALHLAVAVVPFLGTGGLDQFWHYNKTLFLSLLTGALYTSVLWIGLAIAMAALDNLFGVDVPGKRYGELWMILVGIFNTWFVLGRVPDEILRKEAVPEYPRGLKVFTQYILLPLVVVYLVILYAYAGKILIEWDWPQGWVSKLILGFAGTGIFSFLLIYPISGRSENVWINRASRWFFVALIPLLPVLFLALSRRVSEYGYTEGRYLAFALGIWLCVVVIYFLASTTKSIRFIPESLCIAAFVVSFGPWGFAAVSEGSQVSRLEALLAKNGILVDGKIRPAEGAVSFDDRKQISSVVAYLTMFHGLNSIQPWFTESLLADSAASAWDYKDPATVTKLMGLEYTRAWEFSSTSMMFFTPDIEHAVGIGGYEQMVRMRVADPEAPVAEIKREEFGYRFDRLKGQLVFWTAQGGVPLDSVQIEFAPLVAALLDRSASEGVDDIPPEDMTITEEGDRLRVKMFLVQLEVRREGEETGVRTFNANLFYSVKLQSR